MLKNLIIRLILIILIISSVLGIAKQVQILLGAQRSIRELEAKITRLETQNSQLEEAIK